MGRVEGKVCIVTGAASNPGLGYASAQALAREGGVLVVTDIDEEGLEACASAIRDAGGEVASLRQDVTSEAGWEEVVGETVERFGRLDVLVNNAGIAVLKPIEKLSLEDWNRQIEVNLTSVFLGCKHAFPAMRASGGGSLINMSSVAGLVGIETCTAYGAAKGGVRIASKSIAMEGAKDNIRCNTIHPGVIWTNMQAQATGQAEASDVPAGSSRIPLGRVGQPSDIAACVVYLASDDAGYVTGTEFTIDAGMTAQ
jgi:NAD(P)-dependent dehydrogenase (short-subunit alcohol dehydrogenase family)